MRFEKLSKFTVIQSGERWFNERIENYPCQLPYLSEKDYEDLSNPQLIGYASIRRTEDDIKDEYYRYSSDIIGLLQYDDMLISNIRKTKNQFKRIKGYFDVGGNQYVAIEENSLFLFLIPLLLVLLIIGLCASCGGINNDDPDPTDPWQPVIEENLGEYQESTTEQLQNVIYGFSDWHVAEGETENLPISLTNPDGNSGYFSFVITLADSGEELYRSAMVKPGDTIRSININRPLETGQYTALIYIFINDLETGNEMTPFNFQVRITVD